MPSRRFEPAPQPDCALPASPLSVERDPDVVAGARRLTHCAQAGMVVDRFLEERTRWADRGEDGE